MNKRLQYQIIRMSIWVVTVIAVIGCAPERRDSSGSGQLVIEDMHGREITLTNKVERVVCMRAGALRMLAYLDAVEYVAGIEEPERQADRPYLMANPQLRELPSVGPLMGGDSELLVAADPDVIFMTFTTAGQADELQNRTGIPVVALEYGDFSLHRDTFFESLKKMASVLGKEDRADELIAYIRSSLEELNERTSGHSEADSPRVYVGGVSYSGTRGIASTEPFYPPFRFINAQNVAGEIDERLVNPIQGTFIDREQLIMWDPEVVFVDLASWSVTRGELSPGTPLYESMSALRNGEVYGVLPYNNYAANYENILANTWYVAGVLYPDLFGEVDIRDKVDEVYERFLGVSVYDELKEVWGGYRQLDRELP